MNQTLRIVAAAWVIFAAAACKQAQTVKPQPGKVAVGKSYVPVGK